jgi:hypothetical protein
MTLDEWQACDDAQIMLDFLRGRIPALQARHFACVCVRRIWNEVITQKYVSVEVIAQCCRAVELTELSVTAVIPSDDLKAVDFEVITDAGDDAFIAAAHVGWNLFAPLHNLDAIDEFDVAKQTAALTAYIASHSERVHQCHSLRELVPYTW